MANGDSSIPEEKEALRDLIQASASRLDHEQFVDYINLFADAAQYELVAKSREIGGKETPWLAMNKSDLSQLLSEIPDHVRDEAERLHLVSPIRVDVKDDEASGLSNFAIFRTTTAGESQVYAVGHYEDTFIKRDGKWWFAKHRVVVHTRMLQISTHVPF